MAVLKQGILGGGRNAVGTVVMSNWKGKDVICARVSPSNPNTQAQQAARALFRGLATLATYLMDSFIRPYWTRFENGTTAYNEWMRANQALMRSALSLSTGSEVSDYGPSCVCIFRRKLDGDSDGNWTPIPTETGHGFRRKVDGDSERKWYTFERGLGISTRELQRDVRGAG